MKLILICPAYRPKVSPLADKRPLVLVPFLGKTVLDYALSHFAAQGAKELTLLVADRAEMVQKEVGRGEAWGLPITVLPTPTEPSVEEVRGRCNPSADECQVRSLDELPGLPGHPLWTSLEAWRDAQLAFMRTAAGSHVGMRETAPDVFVHARSQVSPGAQLIAPCWVGANVAIEKDVGVGPGAIVEEGCYLDRQSTVLSSVIGPFTYLGAVTYVRNSFAWESDLLHLGTGALTKVPDRFLLRGLQSEHGHGWRSCWSRAARISSQASRRISRAFALCRT